MLCKSLVKNTNVIYINFDNSLLPDNFIDNLLEVLNYNINIKEISLKNINYSNINSSPLIEEINKIYKKITKVSIHNNSVINFFFYYLSRNYIISNLYIYFFFRTLLI